MTLDYNVADEYPEGRCPDCNEEIDPHAVEGDECSNCGHVFWLFIDVEDLKETA
jgi:Zn finger protein HypA/HybF involved in hydrogenase expression